ncbi:MAG: ribulose-phosphate 3-epimerase [Candidatus Synoicihabitans palmerolidicus]|nr:ribulose-phosphate 3-epimerase [Candidatus Synoicihabitans palmerolidicus]
MKFAPLLAPSLLAGDHAALGDSAEVVPAHGLRWLHIDIMDAHFVPNLTFGPEIVAALHRRPALQDTFFDTHLMLGEPQHYVEAFAQAGSNLISIHIEPDYNHAATLRHIRELGCQNGIVLNPDTPAKAIEPYLNQVDLVLIMTVQPGFGSQNFRRTMMPKLEQIDTWRQERALPFRLEVDGGVDLTTGPLCCAAGADTFVAGTSFFKATDRAAFVAAVQDW